MYLFGHMDQILFCFAPHTLDHLLRAAVVASHQVGDDLAPEDRLKTGNKAGCAPAAGADYLGLGQGILHGVGSHCGNPALKDGPLEETFSLGRQGLFRMKVGQDEQQRGTGTLEPRWSIRLLRSHQDGCADASCRFSGHGDSLRVATKGLDVLLHPPEGRQLVQETPVTLSVFVPAAVDEEKRTLPRIRVSGEGRFPAFSPQEAQDAQAVLDDHRHNVLVRRQRSAVKLTGCTHG